MHKTATSPESLHAALAGGVFYRCDKSGLRLISGSEELADFLGVDPADLSENLGAVLGKDSPNVYAEVFESASDDSASFTIPYMHPRFGKRWFSIRRSPVPEVDKGFLAFLRDETVLHESMVKVAAAQSRDVENSARLQAAVLMEGQRLQIPDLDYHTATIPSKLVDGDFLDVLRLSGNSVDFLLGDVMGKGMDAAILGAMIKFSFARALSISLFGAEDLPDPSRICHNANAAVASRLFERQSFATLTYARFEATRKILKFVDCGHTSIVHYSRRTGECWRVKGGNMPLGFMKAQTYRSFMLPIDPGDCLLMYTDGLSECCNRWDEAFGEERVAYLLRTYADLPAPDLTGTILRLGFAYSAAGFNDDVSLVCVKYNGETPATSFDRSLNLTLKPAGFSAFEKVENLLGDDLDAWTPGLGIETRSEILLAMHEALTNILEHGLGGKDGPCEIRWRYLEGLLSIEFTYSGPDYDWASRPVSPLSSFADSGYGRLIMDKAMDSLLLAQGFYAKKRLVMCRCLDIAASMEANA
jgi:serine phosphatase RsbU (regulator of sigma subunit)